MQPSPYMNDLIKNIEQYSSWDKDSIINKIVIQKSKN